MATERRYTETKFVPSSGGPSGSWEDPVGSLREGLGLAARVIAANIE